MSMSKNCRKCGEPLVNHEGSFKCPVCDASNEPGDEYDEIEYQYAAVMEAMYDCYD